MAPPLPRVRPTGSGSISGSEFKRYVDALGQMAPMPTQQPTPPIQPMMQPQVPMGSGSTTDMEKRAYQRYIDALSRLRAAEQQSDRPIGSGSTTDSEFQRYTAPPSIGPLGDFTSGLPPEFSEATAAKNEYEKMRHYNRVMGGGTSSDAEWRAYEKATKPPSIGPLGDFFRSMRRKLP
jgi:hypothetical protein